MLIFRGRDVQAELFRMPSMLHFFRVDRMHILLLLDRKDPIILWLARISESYSTKVKRVVCFLQSQPSLREERERESSGSEKSQSFCCSNAGMDSLGRTKEVGRNTSAKRNIMLSVSAFIFGVSLASMESPQKMMDYRVSRARKLDLFQYTRQRIFPRLRYFLSLFIPTICSDGGKYVIDWPRKIKRAEHVRLSNISTGRLDPSIRLDWSINK